MKHRSPGAREAGKSRRESATPPKGHESGSARQFRGKFPVASTDPAKFEPVFDLFAAIEESRQTYDKKDRDVIKSLTLYSLPTYVRANLNRVIHDEGVSHEEARWCCIEFGVRQLFASPRFKAWKKLYEQTTSRKTRYKNDGDWDDVQECLNRFRFKPRDLHTGTYTTNARIPEPIRAQVSGAAKVLGMSASTVATTCIIDALRVLEDVMHKDDMDATIEEFYGLLERRTKRLRHLLVEVEAIRPGEAL